MSSVNFCVSDYNHLAAINGRVLVIKSFDGGVEGHAGEKPQYGLTHWPPSHLQGFPQRKGAVKRIGEQPEAAHGYGCPYSRYQARPVESISPRLITLPTATARHFGCRHGYVSAADFFGGINAV